MSSDEKEVELMPNGETVRDCARRLTAEAELMAQSVFPRRVEALEMILLRHLSATPTPASLRALAEWFDSPNKSPAMSVRPSGPNGERYTPGYLLRLIADAMEGR